MTKKDILLLVLIAILIAIFFTRSTLYAQDKAQEQDRNIIKRYAVVMGANNGGKDRVKLRYAIADAKAMSQVLQDLGGVMEEDNLLLLDPDVKTFYTEMGKLLSRMERERPEYSRVEVIFYYSGHSDEGNILLGDEKLSYEDFRQTIQTFPADVHIAILDSCLSGAFARLKGGKKKMPFLVDEAYDMKGYAFMTSSSATEASQESDLLGGSFFTHYLISGIRGAADLTQDGRVTLNEAYQFT
ncbi:MAG: caspase family protein, partial [Candidatus Aminicenantes bacterium]|nr:caspase family protein [Candidatus Aminicenantes bacterium]